MLYLTSDFLYLVVRYIVRYRKKIIQDNLRRSFPEKSNAEIRSLMKGFYRYFCDLIVETAKLISIPEEKLASRIPITGEAVALIKKYYEEGRIVIAMSGHYANWEWMSVMPRVTNYRVLVTYKILSNQFFENLTKSMRERFGAKAIDFRQTFRAITELEREGIPTITWICGDQSPNFEENTQMLVPFLNQETYFFSGTDKIARKKNAVVIFINLRKKGRGRYHVDFDLITDDPNSLPEGEIIRRYAKRIESLILEAPANWLWSHNRWKHRPRAS